MKIATIAMLFMASTLCVSPITAHAQDSSLPSDEVVVTGANCVPFTASVPDGAEVSIRLAGPRALTNLKCIGIQQADGNQERVQIVNCTQSDCSDFAQQDAVIYSAEKKKAERLHIPFVAPDLTYKYKISYRAKKGGTHTFYLPDSLLNGFTISRFMALRQFGNRCLTGTRNRLFHLDDHHLEGNPGDIKQLPDVGGCG